MLEDVLDVVDVLRGHERSRSNGSVFSTSLFLITSRLPRSATRRYGGGEMHIEQLLPRESEHLLFSARDPSEPLLLRVPLMLWETLQAEAPLPCDEDDRRDHALLEIEVRAAACAIVTKGGDRSVTLDA